ncbi:MAG TPA: DsbA family protein [Solirubrobacteraceae bacterium]|nr:DsbA family protein [Solirubrobacteraceae bacterium]
MTSTCNVTFGEPHPTFYFDVGSPYAYLTAERIDAVLPGPVTWQPISLGGLFKANGRSSWALAGSEPRGAGIAEVERRARAYGLPPVRWPEPWPSNYLFAMRALTFAFARGFGREFALAAFRAGFVAGRDLAVPEHVLDAAADAGLDRQEVADATADSDVKLALRNATDAAHARGVIGVPTVAVEGRLFFGDDRLGEAAASVGV